MGDAVSRNGIASRQPAPSKPRTAQPERENEMSKATSAAPASALPEGMHSITPHIVVKDVPAAIAYYEKVFGAREVLRMPAPDGSASSVNAPEEGSKRPATPRR